MYPTSPESHSEPHSFTTLKTSRNPLPLNEPHLIMRNHLPNFYACVLTKITLPTSKVTICYINYSIGGFPGCYFPNTNNLMSCHYEIGSLSLYADEGLMV